MRRQIRIHAEAQRLPSHPTLGSTPTKGNAGTWFCSVHRGAGSAHDGIITSAGCGTRMLSSPSEGGLAACSNWDKESIKKGVMAHTGVQGECLEQSHPNWKPNN